MEELPETALENASTEGNSQEDRSSIINMWKEDSRVGTGSRLAFGWPGKGDFLMNGRCRLD